MTSSRPPGPVPALRRRHHPADQAAQRTPLGAVVEDQVGPLRQLRLEVESGEIAQLACRCPSVVPLRVAPVQRLEVDVDENLEIVREAPAVELVDLVEEGHGRDHYQEPLTLEQCRHPCDPVGVRQPARAVVPGRRIGDHGSQRIAVEVCHGMALAPERGGDRPRQG